jgi:hypothetical protein
VKFTQVALGIAISAGLVGALSPQAKPVPERVVSGVIKNMAISSCSSRGLDDKLAPLGSMRPI